MACVIPRNGRDGKSHLDDGGKRRVESCCRAEEFDDDSTSSLELAYDRPGSGGHCGFHARPEDCGHADADPSEGSGGKGLGFNGAHDRLPLASRASKDAV